MWYIKFCLICLIINLIANVITIRETGQSGNLTGITVLSFIPLVNIGFTLLSLLIIVTKPFCDMTKDDEE